MTRPPETSTSHLVLIPSYNTGRALLETVTEALQFWRPVWVVIDGSTDGSGEQLAEVESKLVGLRVISLPTNQGKGGAVMRGMQAARAAGFQYALVMDADGQHPADRIPVFMQLMAENPAGMVLGMPEFGADAPFARKHGRLIGNFFANVETLWGGVFDSLFGFRAYPIQASLLILEHSRLGRRYDFDTLLAVQLYWAGVRPVNVKVPVKYLSATAGGVSHFRYIKDNLMLVRLHLYLLAAMLPRIPALVRLRGTP